jgi:hypothetical protein
VTFTLDSGYEYAIPAEVVRRALTEGT